jgi:hypothetical protein
MQYYKDTVLDCTEMYAVWVDGQDLYLISETGGLTVWDGRSLRLSWLDKPVGSIKRIWKDGQEMYIVGTNGSISYYDGAAWRRLNSGTDLDIHDVWGAVDPRTGKRAVYCAATNMYTNDGRKLLRLDGAQVTALPDSGLPREINSAWFAPGRMSYVGGTGLVRKRDPGGAEPWERITETGSPVNYTHMIRGNGGNDVITVGGYYEITHFNGRTWKSYYFWTADDGNLWSVGFKKDFLVAVGMHATGRAVIVRGYRK